MSLTLQKGYIREYKDSGSASSPWKRFIRWSDQQEAYRLGWTSLAIAGHGCIFTILTVMSILLAGNSFILWPFAIGAMAVCLIVNLAAMPTRITVPVFFGSLLIDLVIIGICIAQGMSFSAIYP